MIWRVDQGHTSKHRMIRAPHPLSFEIIAKCNTTKARASTISLKHSSVPAPVFMPVGTQGTMKGITSRQLEGVPCEIILANTYHLGVRPGEAVLQEVGGLHKLMSWNKSLLTDSGGFQMVSLSALAQVTEEGVTFASPRDPTSTMLLTPEMSIRIQWRIKSDIVMQLDDVIPPLSSGERMLEATERSVRWLDRCMAAELDADQNLFPIIQGGIDLDLRERCINEMLKRDLCGYAIGGLCGGEDKGSFWRIIDYCTSRLDASKPVYCMGIGYCIDILVCVALGVDMFDCVYITRTARFGHALTISGSLSLKQACYADDFSPIDENCKCMTCARYTRAFLHHALIQETVVCHLITIHNLHFQMNFMKQIRDSIINQTFPEFVMITLRQMYGEVSGAPDWVIDAFKAAGISFV